MYESIYSRSIRPGIGSVVCLSIKCPSSNKRPNNLSFFHSIPNPIISPFYKSNNRASDETTYIKPNACYKPTKSISHYCSISPTHLRAFFSSFSTSHNCSFPSTNSSTFFSTFPISHQPTNHKTKSQSNHQTFFISHQSSDISTFKKSNSSTNLSSLKRSDDLTKSSSYYPSKCSSNIFSHNKETNTISNTKTNLDLNVLLLLFFT